MKNPKCRLPNDAYIFRATDDTGMFQHAKQAVPAPTEGYTTDDNARALIMAAQLYEATGEQKYLDLTARYLGFLLYAQNGAWFRNFMDYDRRFTEEKGAEDGFGRGVWALGLTASRPGRPAGVRDVADGLLRQTVSGCDGLFHIRSKAYAAVGLHYWKTGKARDFLTKLAFDLAVAYEHSAAPDWKWFENEITYCTAVLPWAMLTAYETIKDQRYREIGLESLDFLLSTTFVHDVFRPVGCKGWFPRGGKAAEFDQQPVEACGTLLVCLKAHELTGKELYRNRARQCLDWYTGQNSLGISLIDPDSGGCMDGLRPEGLNRNEGAESLVCWMIASLAWLKYSGQEGERDGQENL